MSSGLFSEEVKSNVALETGIDFQWQSSYKLGLAFLAKYH